MPGLYNATVDIEERGADLEAPRVHRFVVPVKVQ
jgi:hypothetical protein